MDELDLVDRERTSAAGSGSAPRTRTGIRAEPLVATSSAAPLGRGSPAVRAAPERRPTWRSSIRTAAGFARSAAAVAPVVQDLVQARSVLDVGGGEGWWASAFSRLGATAVSIDNAPLSSPAPGITCVEHDLRRPIGRELGAPDLVLCLEVAEHLEPAVGDHLVGELCSLAPAVLFSAAVPAREGWVTSTSSGRRTGSGGSRATGSMLGRTSLAVLVRRSSRVVVPAEPDPRHVDPGR